MTRSTFRKISPLVLIFAILAFLMPRESKFPYDYSTGREWKYETMFAQFDFPIYKTEEEIREERNNATAQVIPYYKYSEETVTDRLSAVENLDLGILRSAVLAQMRAVYEKGVMSDEERRQFETVQGTDVIYIQKDKRAVKHPISEVYTQTEARAALSAGLRQLFTEVNVDSVMRKNRVSDYLVPNLVYDEQTTMLVQAESEAEISPTSGYVNAGQLIVSEGEIVTEEIKQMLDSYKNEFESNVGHLSSPVLILLGNCVLALGIVIFLYLTIHFCAPGIVEDNRYYYTLLVFTLFACLSLLLLRTDESLIFACPFTLAVLMLQTFHKPRAAVPLYIVTLLPALLFYSEGPVLFDMYKIAGLVSLKIFKRV